MRRIQNHPPTRDRITHHPASEWELQCPTCMVASTMAPLGAYRTAAQILTLPTTNISRRNAQHFLSNPPTAQHHVGGCDYTSWLPCADTHQPIHNTPKTKKDPTHRLPSNPHNPRQRPPRTTPPETLHYSFPNPCKETSGSRNHTRAQYQGMARHTGQCHAGESAHPRRQSSRTASKQHTCAGPRHTGCSDAIE